jgi:hypothetical protein
MAVAGKFNIAVESLKQRQISAILRAGGTEPPVNDLATAAANDAAQPDCRDDDA